MVNEMVKSETKTISSSENIKDVNTISEKPTEEKEIQKNNYDSIELMNNEDHQMSATIISKEKIIENENNDLLYISKEDIKENILKEDVKEEKKVKKGNWFLRKLRNKNNEKTKENEDINSKEIEEEEEINNGDEKNLNLSQIENIEQNIPKDNSITEHSPNN